MSNIFKSWVEEKEPESLIWKGKHITDRPVSHTAIPKAAVEQRDTMKVQGPAMWSEESTARIMAKRYGGEAKDYMSAAKGVNTGNLAIDANAATQLAADGKTAALNLKETAPVDAASSGMSTASWVSLAAKVLGAIVGDGSKQGQAARNPGNYQVALLPGYKGEEEDQPYYGI